MVLINDGTKSNETRLGAIGSIQFALDSVDGFRSKEGVTKLFEWFEDDCWIFMTISITCKAPSSYWRRYPFLQ